MTTSNGSATHRGDLVQDVVVVGAGGAGMSAALAARAEGAGVVVLESADRVGGTTARSGGYIWIPNNSLLRKRGLEDPRRDALRYMCRGAFRDTYDPESPTFGATDEEFRLLETFYDRAADVIDRLTDLGGIRPTQEINLPDKLPYTTMDWLDYYEYLPEDKLRAGRNIRTEPQDIPMPSYLTRAGAWGGWDLAQTLLRGLERHNVEVKLSHRVTGVHLNERNEVVGVQAATPDGEVNVWARKAVIFGSGGFPHNVALREKLLVGPIYGSCAAPTAQGDFLQIGWAIGAATGNLQSAWWQEVPFERALVEPSDENNVFSPPGDSMIVVNRSGVRVVNEKDVYQERTRAHFAWDVERREFPNRILFMIYDQRTADLFAGQPPLPMNEAQKAYVIAGQTIEELTANVRERLEKLADQTDGLRLDDGFAATLQQTIERFNGFASAGYDPDFGRGLHEIDIPRLNATKPGNDKNPVMFPISMAGPIYCVLLGGGALDTNGGPMINEKSQVLNQLGKPIPGLYGAGNCIASPSQIAYWAGGTTLGLAMTFGFIAGENGGREADKLATSTDLRLVQGTDEVPPEVLSEPMMVPGLPR